jgi:O-antigen/teichoic acid export membrane protein
MRPAPAGQPAANAAMLRSTLGKRKKWERTSKGSGGHAARRSKRALGPGGWSLADNASGAALRATSVTAAAALATALVAIARGKAIALFLGPSGMGVYGAYLSLVSSAAALADLGAATSGAKEIAAAHGEHDAAVARRALVLGNVALGALGMAVVVAMRERLSTALFGNAANAPDIGVLGLGVLLTLLANGQLAILQGSRRIGRMALANIAGAVAALLCGLAVLALFGDRAIAGFVVLGPAAVGCAAAILVARSGTARVRVEARSAWLRWRSMIRLGLAVMGGAIIAQLSLLAVRALLARQLPDGLAAAGLFHAAWTLSMGYLGFVLNAMSADYFPALAAIAADERALNRAVNRQSEMALLLSAPALLAVAAFPAPLLWLFFDATFTPASELLRLQVLGDVLKVASWPVAFAFLARGDVRAYVATEIVAYATYLVVTWALLPYLGLLAAGVGFGAMYLAYFLAVVSIARARHGFAWEGRMDRTLLACLAAVVATLWAAGTGEIAARWTGGTLACCAVAYAGFWMRDSGALPRGVSRWLGRGDG